jgi:hypothetical protein
MIYWSYPLGDDEEETPAITHYELVDVITGNVLGKISMGPDGATPDQYGLMSIPYFAAMWSYFHGLRYDFIEDAWFVPDDQPMGGTKIFEARPVYSQPKPKMNDYCRKCNERGQFIRTALICPKCKAVLGGF